MIDPRNIFVWISDRPNPLTAKSLEKPNWVLIFWINRWNSRWWFCWLNTSEYSSLVKYFQWRIFIGGAHKLWVIQQFILSTSQWRSNLSQRDLGQNLAEVQRKHFGRGGSCSFNAPNFLPIILSRASQWNSLKLIETDWKWKSFKREN